MVQSPAKIDVKWQNKKFPVEFPSQANLDSTTVKQLKEYCHRMTGLDVKEMKLSAFGGKKHKHKKHKTVMNNDSMPLNVYGIRPGCFVTLKQKARKHQNKDHDHHHHKESQTNNKASNTAPNNNNNHSNNNNTNKAQEESNPLLNNLKTIQNKIKEELTPQVKDYEKSVKTFLNENKEDRTEKEHKKQVYTGAYLGEQLMHVLFDLDGISCGQDLVARQARKEAVNGAQALLDKVDELKSLVKNV